MDLNMQLNGLRNHSFCIYGAGIVSVSAYMAVKTLYQNKPLFFLVTDPEDGQTAADLTPQEIDGIEVKYLSQWQRELQSGIHSQSVPEYYLIATPALYHEAIRHSLHLTEGAQIADSQMIFLTGERENELMELYYSQLPDHTTVRDLLEKTAVQRKDASNLPVQVFQAKSHMDHSLQNVNDVRSIQGQLYHWAYRQPSYIQPVQAGAALTDRVIAGLRDDEGDNISRKNCNYCELTVTYYAWKHCTAAYKGICHYRRIFDISDTQMRMLLQREQEWDVILPYPSVHDPDISTQHLRYVKEADWQGMLQALSETAPEYLRAYEKYIAGNGRFFYNFNMLIAKAEVFDDYCDFLFRVLERTEEMVTPKEAERADRFAGYLGENLTTLYFLKNRDCLKIVNTGKFWLT